MEYDFLSTLPIAHRGLHDTHKPENSISAFRAAIQAGYAIETDVRLSRDGELVIFHDDSLARMTGVEKSVESLDAEELTGLRLDQTQERIPLFVDFLEEIDGKTPLLLEIKNVPLWDKKYYMLKVAGTLARYYHGEVAVQSFNPFYIKEFKRLCPNIRCGLLGTPFSTKEDFGGGALWRIKARAMKNLSFARSIKPEFISYEKNGYPNKTTEKFEKIKLAWTVRSPEEEARVRQYADNIIFENYLPEIPKQP